MVGQCTTIGHLPPAQGQLTLMILLSARDLTRQFDSEPGFAGLGLEIRAGDRVGLVGPNGSGKTTLLNILAGLDEPDTGAIDTPRTVRVGLLEQQPNLAADRTLWDEAADGLQWLYELQREAETLAEQISQESSDTLLRRYDTVHATLEQHSGFQIDHRVAEVLEGLGFEADNFHRPLTTFSGGQQARASLARLLLTDPDVMLLDEPTNHLDIAATEWLESFLVRARPAMILVSHDRFFLDKSSHASSNSVPTGSTPTPAISVPTAVNGPNARNDSANRPESNRRSSHGPRTSFVGTSTGRSTSRQQTVCGNSNVSATSNRSTISPYRQ